MQPQRTVMMIKKKKKTVNGGPYRMKAKTLDAVQQQQQHKKKDEKKTKENENANKIFKESNIFRKIKRAKNGLKFKQK